MRETHQLVAHAPIGAGVEPATEIHVLDGNQTLDPSVHRPGRAVLAILKELLLTATKSLAGALLNLSLAKLCKLFNILIIFFISFSLSSHRKRKGRGI